MTFDKIKNTISEEYRRIKYFASQKFFKLFEMQHAGLTQTIGDNQSRQR